MCLKNGYFGYKSAYFTKLSVSLQCLLHVTSAAFTPGFVQLWPPNGLKKISIAAVCVIENLGLPARCPGFNLQMSEFSDTHRVNSPGTSWKQSLASIALRDDSSLLLRSQMAWVLCPPSTPASPADRGFSFFREAASLKALTFGAGHQKIKHS